MDKDIKVSVIVPIYNGEKILEKSLLILARQTLNNIEFVCVNDASTDGSLNILKAFKEVFPDKFVIIDSKKNRGPGGARNIGLKYARGEYIGFMDQDDYVHQEMYEAMYLEGKNGDYDIVKCAFYDRASGDISEIYEVKGKVEMSQKIANFISDSFYIWNKIYKRSLVDKMSMWFRENTYNDDSDFFLESVMWAESVSTVPKAYYYYNYEGESYSRGKCLDLNRDIKATDSFIQTLEKRFAVSPHRDLGEFVYNNVVEYEIKRLFLNMVFKKELCEADFEGFQKFAKVRVPKYLDFKDCEADNIKEMVYSRIDKDPKNTYKNILQLKEEIVNGKYGENVQKYYMDVLNNRNVIGGFEKVDF